MRPNSENIAPVMAFMTSGRSMITVTTSPERSTTSPSAPSGQFRLSFIGPTLDPSSGWPSVGRQQKNRPGLVRR